VKRIAAIVEYDGSAYSGWQRQLGQQTVQQEVEQALSRIANHELGIIAAGRTDTGVHACGQVIHFDTESVRDDYQWQRGCNSFLPDDIRVQWVGQVDDNFHARFSARQRYYRYIILNSSAETALLSRQVTQIRRPLDVVLMDSAAQALVGKHDFTSYRAVSCQAKSPVRKITHLQLNRQSSWIWIDVKADGFLHHMVRNIVGTLLEVGSGERDIDWPEQVLKGRDRRLGGITAPPFGLYLVAVCYQTIDSMPEPRIPRFW